jgi:hypothetical protein
MQTMTIVQMEFYLAKAIPGESLVQVGGIQGGFQGMGLVLNKGPGFFVKALLSAVQAMRGIIFWQKVGFGSQGKLSSLYSVGIPSYESPHVRVFFFQIISRQVILGVFPAQYGFSKPSLRHFDFQGLQDQTSVEKSGRGSLIVANGKGLKGVFHGLERLGLRACVCKPSEFSKKYFFFLAT